jgi:hypothetical protein
MATHAYRPKDPEHDIVALEFANRGISLQRWKEYSFLSHFLTPADGWSFTTSHHDELEVLRALQPGELVRL